jgi:hypothetical protein
MLSGNVFAPEETITGMGGAAAKDHVLPGMDCIGSGSSGPDDLDQDMAIEGRDPVVLR